MSYSRLTLLASLLFAGVFASASARAQTYVMTDCQPFIAAAPHQDSLTARWYQRFWNGDCKGLHFSSECLQLCQSCIAVDMHCRTNGTPVIITQFFFEPTNSF